MNASKVSIKPFLVNVPILDPLKTFGFLVFSRGLKWEHWPEMSQDLENMIPHSHYIKPM